MNSPKIPTLSKKVDDDEPYVADLDQALDVIGLGTYNLGYCVVLALFLIAAIVEPVGYAYLLPASKCDLEMSNAARGFIASVPYIGVILTSFPWGYVVDTRGRKPTLISASLGAGFLGIVASFMPELISFTIFKFLAALCIASPAAVPYTYIGEMLPARYRDITLSVVNSMQIMGSALVPLYAWAVLPSDFRVDFGAYDFRSWRLLCIVYSLNYLIAAALMSKGPESPKFLVSQGRYDDAMDVLRTMYSKNKGKAPEDFPIKALKRLEDNQKDKPGFLTSVKLQSLPLLRPPYLKWLMLNGFVLFGIFNVLNGLAMWIPDVLNRVLSGSSSSGITACEIMSQGHNTTQPDAVCVDSIDTITFVVNSAAAVACSIIALVISTCIKLVGKKILLISILLLIGLFCILINVTTIPMLFAVLLSATTLSGVAIGPVNAYSVEIFPTNLRGMAVGLSMMIGRTGSILGANLAGALINMACEAMFYYFGGLLILCGGLTCLLPRSRSPPKNKKAESITRL